MNYSDLLSAYRDLWTNRSLPVEKDDYQTLIDSIIKELKDEMTHPRIRKSHMEKFYYSVSRIISSSLNNEQKTQLIDLHILAMKNIENNKH
ncbi:hypothetical protein FS935_02870 [Metabacillus litoralis]|uniref:Uncharacterized protein n=1 Tax=Metabacillus litoralis TaxID=152268 RepID=A0A5C6W5R7_9BACI|nr:hypothetical protein [Metabacillus litoralis]TXC93151.1 hypothetical protein FS935_02870 [Metabacillus litoralis]